MKAALELAYLVTWLGAILDLRRRALQASAGRSSGPNEERA